MRKLSGASSYTVGLNIGETGVGFSAVDDEGGEVLFHRGKPVMGVHLYNSAKHADGARAHRTARRTLRRKQARVREIERIFEPTSALPPTATSRRSWAPSRRRPTCASISWSPTIPRTSAS